MRWTLQPNERPHILLITTDQQHWNTIHALGNDAISTPHLDRLVRDGVSFRRAYVTNPVCSPSRSSMITGEYPSRHGCWHVGVALSPDRATIGGLLSEHGYATGLFGKAHFQPCERDSFEAPPHIHDRDFWRGFDGPYYGFEKVSMVHGHGDSPFAHGMHYGAWLEDQGVDPLQYFLPGTDNPWGEPWPLPESLHYTRWTADQTIRFMEEHSVSGSGDKPFFAWCSFQDPHDKFLCPEPWAGMYDPDRLPPFVGGGGTLADKPAVYRYLMEGRIGDFPREQLPPDSEPPINNQMQCLIYTNDSIGLPTARKWLAAYYGMISLVDHHVGRLLDKLEELGIADRTLVIFTSDHGEYAGNRNMWLKGPLHYDDVIKVPFLASWKGRIPAGVRTDALFSLADLAPTLLAACGLPPEPHMQGINQLPTLEQPQQASRDWCLVENRTHTTYYVKTLVTERYKLNYYLQREEGELYDLLKDPGEERNLYDRPGYEAVKLRLLQKLIDVYGELENPYPPRTCFA